MCRVSTFLRGLIGRLKMKEARIAIVMTLIAAAFPLMLQGANTSDLRGKVIFMVCGFALLVAATVLWLLSVGKIKERDRKDRRSRDNSTKAMNDLVGKLGDLVDELQKDRSEREKNG